MSEPVKLTVLKVDQPLGDFYIGAIDSKKLNEISYTEIRKFEEGTQDKLAGIQRERSASRLKELSQYVNFDFSTFPTSIILAIDERSLEIRKISEDAEFYELIISTFDGGEDTGSIPLSEAAFILDGQHRLAGLQHLEEGRTFEVNVSIFVGIDLADKAEIFRIVNLTQSKVNRSLSYDLFSYAKGKSPHKYAHEIVVAMNEDENGPFFHKIKRLGKATPGLGKQETLAQATVVDGIIKFITNQPDVERNIGFRSIFSGQTTSYDSQKFMFWPFYEKDDKVSTLQIMTNYFSAVERKWQGAWTEPEEGYILNRTTGYNALMRFLRDAYVHLGSSPGVVTEDDFYEIFYGMNLMQNELTAENFLPGSSGASALYRRLVQEAGF